MTASLAFTAPERNLFTPANNIGWTHVSLNWRVPLAELPEVPHTNAVLTLGIADNDVLDIEPSVEEVTLRGIPHVLLKARFQAFFHQGDGWNGGQLQRRFIERCKAELGLMEAAC
jgi:hypothetical protein